MTPEQLIEKAEANILFAERTEQPDALRRLTEGPDALQRFTAKAAAYAAIAQAHYLGRIVDALERLTDDIGKMNP